jgi:hypothetical protein
VARRIAEAETEEERQIAAAALAFYRMTGRESTSEKMTILREELRAALRRHATAD